jgi:Fuc2NAc and GlcNAc transferase
MVFIRHGQEKRTDMTFVHFLASGVGIFLLAAFLTGAYRRYAKNRDIYDYPNERSSHVSPTPRGGGVAIVICTLLAVGAAQHQAFVRPETFWVLGLGGLLIATIGFWDDRWKTGIAFRLSIQILAALWTVWLLEDRLPVLSRGGFHGPAGYLIVVPAIVWSINLYNFMDGIDGIAAVEAITVSASAGLLLWFGGEPGLAWCSWALAAASVGFLLWNWPPALIFMGDVGSGFLGFYVAGMILISMIQDVKWSAIWVILYGVFAADATVTLIRRLLRKQNISQAHRSHAYQHMARRHGHRTVTLSVAVINVFWLLPWAVVTYLRPNMAWVSLFIALAPLFVLAFRLGAGKDDT